MASRKRGRRRVAAIATTLSVMGVLVVQAVLASSASAASDPTVSISLTSPNGGVPDGSNGWFVTGPVDGTVTAHSDAANIASIECGPVSLSNVQNLGTPDASADFSITSDGDVTVTCTATDDADPANTSDPASQEVKLDTVAPTVARNAPGDSCTLNGTNGWCRGTKSAGFTATDATSGLNGTNPFTQSSATEGSAITIGSGTVCDNAGNCSTDAVIAGPFKTDHTNPVLDSGPTLPKKPKQPYILNQTFSPGFGAVVSGHDDLSGINLAQTKCPAITSTVTGTNTKTCTVTDIAGNQITAPLSYVVGYTMDSISPLSNSSFSKGTSIPVSFTLRDANSIANPDGAGSSIAAACHATASINKHVYCASFVTDHFEVSIPTNALKIGKAYTIKLNVFVIEGSAQTSLASASIQKIHIT